MAYLRHLDPGFWRRRFATAVGVLLAVGCAGRADAQTARAALGDSARLDSLRRFYRVPPPDVQQITVAKFLGAPGSTIGSPSASGAGVGDYFFGVGFQERTRYTDRPDGGFGAGAVLGDPESGVALETTVTSFSSVRHAFLSIGGFSFKVHHRDIPHMMLYAVGIENALTWGHTDGGTSVYGTVGHVVPLRSGDDAAFGVLSTSVGVGTGRFRSEADIRNHRHTVGVFGGLGLRIVAAVSATADWTGQDLDAGFTFTPFAGRGIVGTMGVADLTRHAGNGPRFIMSVGFGFNARRDNRRLSPEDLSAVFRTP
ncbi:MAG: hypothetical protein KGJ70_00155 [Gemmatimonadota bacterium]|nr:hypothetical protein [Gemmatimonadota bacterium]